MKQTSEKKKTSVGLFSTFRHPLEKARMEPVRRGGGGDGGGLNLSDGLELYSLFIAACKPHAYLVTLGHQICFNYRVCIGWNLHTVRNCTSTQGGRVKFSLIF